MISRGDVSHLCALARLGEREIDAFLAASKVIVREAPAALGAGPQSCVFHDAGLLSASQVSPCPRWDPQEYRQLTLSQLLERPCAECLDLSVHTHYTHYNLVTRLGAGQALQSAWGPDPGATFEALVRLADLEATRAYAAEVLALPDVEFLASWMDARDGLEALIPGELRALRDAHALLVAECETLAGAIAARLTTPLLRSHLLDELHSELLGSAREDCTLDQTPTLLGLATPLTCPEVHAVVRTTQIRSDSAEVVLVCLLPRFAADEVIAAIVAEAVTARRPRPQVQTVSLAPSDLELASVTAQLWAPHAPGPLRTLASALEASRDLLADAGTPLRSSSADTPAAELRGARLQVSGSR